MGGRFSRNLRRVIRQEVACAIDEYCAGGLTQGPA